VISVDDRFAIQDLFAEYAATLDEGRLEDWLDFFVEDCVYRIVPRENVDQGLPLALVLCDNKNMLRDRVAALREANEYNLHTDRHLVGGIRFRERRGDVIAVEAGYAVFQVDPEGAATLFAVGLYQDEVVLSADRPRFRIKTVIMDNSCVPHAISTPL
jgi:anthranilate 1,2-dioxygenase small subunit